MNTSIIHTCSTCSKEIFIQADLIVEDGCLVVLSLNPNECPNCNTKLSGYASFDIYIEEEGVE